MDIEIGRRWSVRTQHVHPHRNTHLFGMCIQYRSPPPPSHFRFIAATHAVRRGTYNIAIYTRSHSTRIPHIYTVNRVCDIRIQIGDLSRRARRARFDVDLIFPPAADSAGHDAAPTRRRRPS